MGNCGLSQRVPPLKVSWCPLVGLVVDCARQHACALELLPVNWAVIIHYVLKMLASIRLYPTHLETQTKESNM